LWIGLACGLAATSLQLLARWRGAERREFLRAGPVSGAAAERRSPATRAD
jgi:hypothetical protein